MKIKEREKEKRRTRVRGRETDGNNPHQQIRNEVQLPKKKKVEFEIKSRIFKSNSL